MRRGMAGLLFVIAAACLALAAGGWWLQRVAFDTATSAEVADVVLQDPAIRDQIATLVATAAADQLGVPQAELRRLVDQYVVANDAQINAVLGTVVADSHARLIGERSEPVQITGEQLVPIVRNESATSVPPITLPVQEVTALNIIRMSLAWFIPLMAIAGGVALLLGVIAHPRKADAIFGIGVFLVFCAAAVVLLGWLVPVYALPEVNDSTWIGVIPAVADHNLPYVIVAAAVLGAGGIGLMLAGASYGRRRSWRTPVNMSRYNEQRRWSR
jgi:hypothetical protein